MRTLSNRNGFLILLAGLAAWIDALSFTELGQVFTSFQSGNFIFLGLAIGCALLVAFAVCWQVVGEPGADSGGRVALLVLAAAAIGVQGAAVFALRIPGVVTNAMTATLMLGGVLLGLRARDGHAAREASPVSAGFLAVVRGAPRGAAVPG